MNRPIENIALFVGLSFVFEFLRQSFPLARGKNRWSDGSQFQNARALLLRLLQMEKTI